jgi:hypothetical protein
LSLFPRWQSSHIIRRQSSERPTKTKIAQFSGQTVCSLSDSTDQNEQ